MSSASIRGAPVSGHRHPMIRPDLLALPLLRISTSTVARRADQLDAAFGRWIDAGPLQLSTQASRSSAESRPDETVVCGGSVRRQRREFGDTHGHSAASGTSSDAGRDGGRNGRCGRDPAGVGWIRQFDSGLEIPEGCVGDRLAVRRSCGPAWIGVVVTWRDQQVGLAPRKTMQRRYL